MYQIVFYTNNVGECELFDYLKMLQNSKGKDARIKFNKIVAYIDMLSQYGLSLGEPYIKHLYNDIWELRPLRVRILFTLLDNNTILLLNFFVKKTNKTPQRELDKALIFLNSYREGI